MKYQPYLSFLQTACFFCFICNWTIAQTPLERKEIQANIEQQARKFIHFGSTKEMDSILAYTPPQFLKAGGLAAMRDLFTKRKLKASVSTTDYEISFEGTGQVHFFLKKMQCAFYYSVKNTSTKAVEIEREGIVGISDSTHQRWYFLAISPQFLPRYKELWPEEIHPKLSFPYSDRVETFANIQWRLKPFLEVQEPMFYSAEYGQIVFNNGSLHNRLYGLANSKGEIIHQPVYAAVSSYRDELMFLDKTTIKYLIAHRSNPKKLLPESSYTSYKPFDEYRFESSGFHLKKIGRDSFLLYNPQGHEEKLIRGRKIEIRNDFIHVETSTVAVYNSRGKLIIPEGLYRETGKFCNHYSTWAKLRYNEFVIVDTNNKVLKTWKLEGIHQQDGQKHFITSLKRNDRFNYGLIDQQGNEITPPIWESIKASNQDMYAVKQKEKWLIYNFKGEKLFKKEFDQVRFEDNYVLLETEKPQKFEIYDLDLKLVKTLAFDQKDLFGELIKDEKTGQVLAQISDIFNQHIYPLQGPAVTEENTNKHQLVPGAIIYRKGDKYGMVGLGGTVLIPAELDEILYQGPQSIWGRIEGRWGLLAIEL